MKNKGFHIKEERRIQLLSEEEIIGKWKGDSDRPLVSIACITFNHEMYIEAAIISFLMQETDFAFEVLLHDDASTDNTTSIIKYYAKRYPNIIKPVFQTENQFSKGVKVNPKFNFLRAKGRFISMCEGDDYWIDSLKLKKQVEAFSEKVSLVHTDVDHLNMLGKESVILHSVNKTRKRTGISGDLSLDCWLRSHSIFTCTMMFKKSDIMEYINSGVLSVDFIAGDYAMFLFLSQMGEVKYLDSSTAVYRTANGSLMNQKNKNTLIDFQIKNINLLNFYFSIFDVDKEIQIAAFNKIKNEIRRRVYLYSDGSELIGYREYFTPLEYFKMKFFRFLGLNRFKLIYFYFKSQLKKNLYYRNYEQ